MLDMGVRLDVRRGTGSIVSRAPQIYTVNRTHLAFLPLT